MCFFLLKILFNGNFCGFHDIRNDFRFLSGAAFQYGGNIIQGGAGGLDCGSVQQLVGSYFQSGGNVNENRQTLFCVSGFNMAHMGGGDTDSLRQFLLREPMGFADFAYLLTDFVIIHKNTAYVVKCYLNYIGRNAKIT